MDGLDEFGIGGESVIRPGQPFHAGLGDIPPGLVDPNAFDLPMSYVRDRRWPQRWNRLYQSAPGEVPGFVSRRLLAINVLSLPQPEDIWPEEIRGTGFAGATAVAGQITEGQILNPAGSGKLVIVEQLTLAQQTLAAILNFSYNTATLPTARNSFPADVRQSSGKVITGGSFGGLKALVSSDTPAAVPTTATASIWGVFMPAGWVEVVPTWYVLPEGVGLLISSGVQGAQSTTVGFIWREIDIPISTPR